MFTLASISFASNRLRLFKTTTRPVEAYALVSDISGVVGIKKDSIRAEMSRNSLGSLISVPELKTWLIDEELIPASTGKIAFATSSVWTKLLERHANDTEELDRFRLCVQELMHHDNDQDNVQINPKVQLDQQVDDQQPDGDGNGVPQEDRVEATDEQLLLERLERPETPPTVLLEPINTLAVSPAHSADLSSPDSSDSSSGSSSDDDELDLPVGVEEWVLTRPSIPEQFSSKNFTKTYALKDYDMPKQLKKQLKKMRNWWMKEHNSERSSKAVGQTTSAKREERVLCFLGFLAQFECVPTRKLTLGLVLNHTLFKSYIEYLKQVRKCSDGTVAEALTSAISACRWLFRKDKRVTEIPIIRRYKDMRNAYQSKANRIRGQNDVEELREKNQWIEWSEFTGLVQNLRVEWSETAVEASDGTITMSQAKTLHDLLLLGLYSIVPSRGCEVRLLQYYAEEELYRLKGTKTYKKFVDQQQINLIAKTENGGGEWKMWVSKYKNVRFHGVDCTELSAFGWWTELLELYLEKYRGVLVGEDCSHRFVFVTRHGDHFTDGYFSEFISGLLFKHTGKKVATNLLRSSFVTHFYDSDASKDPRLQQSVARVMRHSAKQAQQTYDRRTASSRKREGLELLSNLASAPKKSVTVPSVDLNAVPAVVEYQRQPYQIIRTEADRYLVAKMVRSHISNAPLYYTPLSARYESILVSECTPLKGEWENGEFLVE